MLKKYGLVPSMYPAGAGGTIADSAESQGESRPDPRVDPCRDRRIRRRRRAERDTFSGNRNGMSDQEGADNCVAFLDSVKAHAEDKRSRSAWST